MSDDIGNQPYQVVPTADKPARWILVDATGNEVRTYVDKRNAVKRASLLNEQQAGTINLDEVSVPTTPTTPTTPTAEIESESVSAPAANTAVADAVTTTINNTAALLAEYEIWLAAEPNGRSKRAKAQWLVGRGFTVGETARIVGIRYQMVYQATAAIRSEAGYQPAGRCKICGRPLSDPDHVEAGIGPVCSQRESLKGKNFKR